MYNSLPKVRGKYRFDYDISNSTWFGVGGKVDVLFRPEDEDDLSFFLKNKPKEIPHIVLGVCSNVIIRDGGFNGVVIKLGRNFTNTEKISDNEIKAGSAALDVNVAKFAAENSFYGLEFLVGIPGVIGGAIAMNAGAYGAEIQDILISADAIDKNGNKITLQNKDFDFSYRKANFEEGLIFTSCRLKVSKGDREEIISKMENISKSREGTQPIRNKTGGSTFKNPPPNITSQKAWQLIDAAGCRGLKIGDAMVSEKHCNFLINLGNATAQNIEDLGELVRKKVLDNSGIELQWEIKRLGKRLPA